MCSSSYRLWVLNMVKDKKLLMLLSSGCSTHRAPNNEPRLSSDLGPGKKRLLGKWSEWKRSVICCEEGMMGKNVRHTWGKNLQICRTTRIGRSK